MSQAANIEDDSDSEEEIDPAQKYLLDHYKELPKIENKDFEITRIGAWYDHILSGYCRIKNVEYPFRTVLDNRKVQHCVVYPEDPISNRFHQELDKSCDEVGILRFQTTKALPGCPRIWTREFDFSFGGDWRRPDLEQKARQLALERTPGFETHKFLYDDSKVLYWFVMYE